MAYRQDPKKKAKKSPKKKATKKYSMANGTGMIRPKKKK